MSLHIYCRLYGVQHRLRITEHDFTRTPKMVTVCNADFLTMMPLVIVGAAYDTYTPYKILKAGKADFKIRRIERVSSDKWLYVFEDSQGNAFQTYLHRRMYETYRDNRSTRTERQTAEVVRH
ncbi:hypothetical protein HOS33_gp259 [Erwinia phage vB_EamM_Y3]|uniref:Uncharacterized protein n=1 Tax=Erwinia phage vB_EamM_Y3 TaxID=1983553 RepID=A0A2H4IBI0_9CAUD|nr:hypothetical protein HOS33_gp259 [Erwinia phage vB_EamM_Y3]ARW58899.1 hypothetical protein Y3_259 [Erwinia phage vB_EamM_Y3]